MKATKILLAAAAFAATALTTNAQSLFIKQTDGTVHEYAVETVQEVAFGASTENLGKISITYKANDGTEASATQQGIEGKVFAIGKDVNFAAPANMELAGWNTAADGSGVQCADGEMISLNRSLTLYAQWQDKPTQGTENGHNWVDLGLSVKWATCNVGANNPEDYGNYYAWGEIEPETGDSPDYSADTYRYAADGGNTFTKYNSTDNKTTLDIEDDAARQNWGGNWRMPTKDEIQELIDGCNWEWVNYVGYNVTSKTNGNSIFLPAGGDFDGLENFGEEAWGCYWSASYSETSYINASRLDSGTYGKYVDTTARFCGLMVRPVLE